MTLDLQRKSIAYRLWHAMLCFDRGRLISCIEACKGVWQYAWHHRRHVILRVLRANIAESATAPRLLMVGCVRLSPHSRLRRQCGVMQVVTARAVNITGFQFITFIRHLTYNRASGCNFNNPLLTASVAKSATWGKPRSLKTTTVERLQTQRRGQIRILYGRRRCRCPQIALR